MPEVASFAGTPVMLLMMCPFRVEKKIRWEKAKPTQHASKIRKSEKIGKPIRKRIKQLHAASF